MNDHIKICSKCKLELPRTLEFFPKRKESPDGLRAYCRTCESIQKQKYHEENRDHENEKSKRYYWENREESLQKSKEWREKNSGYAKEQGKRWWAENREEANKKQREQYAKNPEHYRERNRKWREENPDKLKVSKKQSYQKNRENILIKAKKYQTENYAKVYQGIKSWKEKNQERVRLYHLSRAHRERGAEGSFNYDEITQLAIDQNHACYYCGKTDIKLTIDHKTPLSRGGSNLTENLCLACGSCNSSKKDKTEEEFWEYRKKRGL